MPRFLSCRSGDGSRTEHRIAGVASSTLFLLPHRKMTAVTARSVSWNSLLARQREASLRTEKRIGAVCWPNRLSQNLSRSSVATTVRSITGPRASIQTSSPLRLHRPPLLRALVLIPHVPHPDPPRQDCCRLLWPFIESWFRTLKYVPSYPSRGFADIGQAWQWCHRFVSWCNNNHHHWEIDYAPSNQRYNGQSALVFEQRRQVCEAARQRHPER